MKIIKKDIQGLLRKYKKKKQILALNDINSRLFTCGIDGALQCCQFGYVTADQERIGGGVNRKKFDFEILSPLPIQTNEFIPLMSNSGGDYIEMQASVLSKNSNYYKNDHSAGFIKSITKTIFKSSKC